MRKDIYAPPKVDEEKNLVYLPVEGREEPPAHNGFARHPDDSHKFIEMILPCDQRRVKITRRPACGAIQFHYYCLNKECQYDGKEVSAAKCNACPFRTLGGEPAPPLKEECEDCDNDTLYEVEWDDECDECIERRKRMFAVYKREREKHGLPVNDIFGVMHK